MSKLNALAVSLSLLVGLWVYISLGPLSKYFLVWVGVIAWASFFHTGGTYDAMKVSLASNIFGATLAYLALNIVVAFSPPVIVTAIIVGITVFIFTIASKVELFSSIPATVYGYGAIVGYSLHQASDATNKTGPLQNLMNFNLENPLILVVISLIAGSAFGFASGKFAGAISAKNA